MVEFIALEIAML